MDFSKLRFDVERCFRQEKFLIDVYPELSDYEEFNDYKDNDLLVIMFLMVDQGSPFLRAYRDSFSLRLEKVYEYLERGRDKIFIEIINGSNLVFNKMVFRWFTISDNLAYERWFSLSLNYHYMTQFLREPPDFKSRNADKNMDTRARVEKSIDGIHRNLIDFEKEVFSDSIVRRVVKEQVAKAVQFPEEYAQDKEDGEGGVNVI